MQHSKKHYFLIGIVVLLFSQLSRNAEACTTFCLFHGKGLIFGRNYDFPIGYGMVVINKQNVSKSAMADAGELAAQWTSKYGSVTFNQFGRDLPTGGMNEMGLIVELSQLDATRYPTADKRPVLGSLEWIQYQLDNAATVQEVIQRANEVRIRSHVGIHFLIADGKGEAASVEFLNGKLVQHSGGKMPVLALANSTYEESLAYLKAFDFACASPVKILDVNADISGDIASHFSNYTTEANRQLVMASFQNSPFTKQVPVSALEEIAKHPESSSCRNLTGSSAKVNATTTSTQK